MLHALVKRHNRCLGMLFHALAEGHHRWLSLFLEFGSHCRLAKVGVQRTVPSRLYDQSSN